APAPDELEPLDRDVVAAAPPPPEQLGFAVGAPDEVERGVELALDADRALVGAGEAVLERGHGSSLRLSSSAPRWSSLSSRSRWYAAIQAASSSRRRGPRLQTRVLPTFRVLTSPTDSRTATCFFVPVSVMPACSASCPMVASPLRRRSRMPSRLGSDSAANVSWTGGRY